ncbi:hypothetical protein GCM10009716_19910 [Streptomyces sodiiphilus]|uniref:PH domain-containing protein n=1 Tax=Streptomyces sodiiphilus TaxID=226217 RepID=A0ABN2P3Q0_9ACTN
MTTPLVPLPPEHLPAGTPSWRSEDVRRWLAASPARWTNPLWSCTALVLASVWAVISIDEPVCTVNSPCGPQWWGMTLAGVALLELYWVARQPRLALLVLGPLTVLMLLTDDMMGEAPFTGNLPFLAAAAFTVAALLERLAAGARQRQLAERTAGSARHPLPAQAAAFRRGRIAFVLASALLAVAGFALWKGLAGVAGDEGRAARADRIEAEVTGRDEDSVTVALPGGERTLEALYPENHPVGERTAVLVDGSWARLVSEPYDAFGWQMLLLATGVPGIAALVNGVDGRRRGLRLRSQPQPALRVLVREGPGDSRIRVFAADDPAGSEPALLVHALPVDSDEIPDDPEATAAAAEEARQVMREVLRGSDTEPPLREAVLYGAPGSGADIAFLAMPEAGDEEPVLEFGVTPVRPASGRAGRQRAAGAAGHGEGRDGGRGGGARRERPRSRPAAEVAAGMTPSERPLSWSAGAASRGVAAFLLLVNVGFIWAVTSDGFGWSALLAVAGLPVLATSVATAANWRVTADRNGLWVAGPWRVRQVRWEELTGVRGHEDALTIVGRHRQIRLGPLGWGWLERKTRGRAVSDRAVEEIRALIHYPELRPAQEADPAQQGMPLGPAAVAAGVLWGAAVLFLL